MRNAGVSFATSICLVLFASCKSGSDPVSQDGALIVHGSEGVLRLDGSIPPGFPLSILPGSRPMAAFARDGGGERLLRLESDVGVVEAIGFYEDELRRRGYSVERTEEMDEGVSLTILRGAGHAGIAAVAVRRRTDGVPGSVIRMTWTQAPRP